MGVLLGGRDVMLLDHLLSYISGLMVPLIGGHQFHRKKCHGRDGAVSPPEAGALTYESTYDALTV